MPRNLGITLILYIRSAGRNTTLSSYNLGFTQCDSISDPPELDCLVGALMEQSDRKQTHV